MIWCYIFFYHLCTDLQETTSIFMKWNDDLFLIQFFFLTNSLNLTILIIIFVSLQSLFIWQSKKVNFRMFIRKNWIIMKKNRTKKHFLQVTGLKVKNSVKFRFMMILFFYIKSCWISKKHFFYQLKSVVWSWL